MGKIALSSEKTGCEVPRAMTRNVIVCCGGCDGDDRTEDVDEGGGVLVRTGKRAGAVK